MYTLPNPPQTHWFAQEQRPPYRPRRWWIETLRFLGLFLFFFAILVLIVMGPTYYTQLAYLWERPTNNYSQKYSLPVSVSTDAGDINNLANQFSQMSPLFTQDTIVIPKIGVDAPIVYLDTTDNKKILDAIKDGIGHYQGTAMPGRNGNAFFTGHSSYYWWSGGEYNEVFARLDKLAIGDLVYIYYRGGKYIYRVNDSFIVRPEQIEVLDQTSEATLSLMTCTPVGTNLRRLIVRANLVGQPPVGGDDFSSIDSLPKPPTILPLY